MPSMPGSIMSTIAASNGIDARELEPFGGGRRQAHLVALARQQRLEDLAHDLLVVDDQNGCRCVDACVPGAAAARMTRRRRPAPRAGRRSENRVPCPTVLSQVIVPPCSWTMP